MLRSLHSLSASARGQLRSVVIQLNNRSWSPCTCVDRNDCASAALAKRMCRSALDSSVPQDLRFIRQWLSTARVVGPLAMPGRLELFIVCDTADVETAELAATGITYFPTLSHCHLRLCAKPDANIRRTSEHAAMKATGQTAPLRAAAPFRFIALPTELRVRILSYTDLVTPLKEVQWDPTQKYHLRFRQLLCGKVREWWGHWENCPRLGDWVPSDSGGYEYPGGTGADAVPRDGENFHHACSFRNCWQRLDRGDCFCQRHHAAYSTEGRCHCWAPPSALFFVGRQFYHDAQYVFFSNNRIIVLPYGCLGRHDQPAHGPPARYPACTFLRSGIASTSLPYLQFLDLVFPPVDCEPEPGDKAQAGWLQTLEWVRSKLDLPRLTLRFEIADYGNQNALPSARRSLNRFGQKNVIKGHVAILRALKALEGTTPSVEAHASAPSGGLRRLFIHVADPSYWTGLEKPPRRRQMTAKRWKELQIEERFEQAVMGQDYDSGNAGKGDIKLAEWKWELAIGDLCD